MAEGGVRDDQRLHRHGVLLHVIADAGIGVDDDLVCERLIALAVERLIAREALAEATSAQYISGMPMEE